MKNNARADWERLGAKRLKISQRPFIDHKEFNNPSLLMNPNIVSYLGKLDKEPFLTWSGGTPTSYLIAQPLVSYYDLYAHVVMRMWDLSFLLAEYYILFKKNPGLYGERMLAHVGNEVLRCYPWLDFPFTSVKAQQVLGGNVVTGLYNFEIKPQTIRNLTSTLHWEHECPISYFRDLFHQQLDFQAEDFFKAMVNNHRVVRITKEEQHVLKSRGFDQHRPMDAYQQCGIQIYEEQIWNEIKRVLI